MKERGRRIPELTLPDLDTLARVMRQIQAYDATYKMAPDPLYNTGKLFRPVMFDDIYASLADQESAEGQLGYLNDLMETHKADFTVYSNYITTTALTNHGVNATDAASTAFQDGVWVSAMYEYISLLCPCICQKTVRYRAFAKDGTPIVDAFSQPVYGYMTWTLNIDCDYNNTILRGTAHYSHVYEGPLPYLQDNIGALYIEDTGISPSMGTILEEWAELCHMHRTKEWRFETLISDDKIEYSLFDKIPGVPAYNEYGKKTSRILVNDWTLDGGKLHAPVCAPFEDWYVYLNMIPLPSIASIVSAKSSYATVTYNLKEYVWNAPTAKPWIP